VGEEIGRNYKGGREVKKKSKKEEKLLDLLEKYEELLGECKKGNCPDIREYGYRCFYVHTKACFSQTDCEEYAFCELLEQRIGFIKKMLTDLQKEK